MYGKTLFQMAVTTPSEVLVLKELLVIQWSQKLVSLLSSHCILNIATYVNVALGGQVVSVLATGPKVHGFKPGRGRWILRVIKSAARLPSEGK
jgi:hypothetical protein